jgi:hypothetical protein
VGKSRWRQSLRKLLKYACYAAAARDWVAHGPCGVRFRAHSQDQAAAAGASPPSQQRSTSAMGGRMPMLPLSATFNGSGRSAAGGGGVLSQQQQAMVAQQHQQQLQLQQALSQQQAQFASALEQVSAWFASNPMLLVACP